MSSYPGILLSGVGQSAVTWIKQLDNYSQVPLVSLGLICTVSSGAVLNYSVLITADPPSGLGLATNWNNHDVLYNLAASANGNVLYPISGISLIINSWSGGTVNLGISQWP